MTGQDFRTPYFYVDEKRLIENLQILKEVAEKSGCRILLAQKAFSMFACYPLMRKYLAGTTASGLYEARLGKEAFGKETHVFSPAYRRDEFEELLTYADHFSFNSPAQLRLFGARAKAAENPWDFGSILSVLPRKGMRSMIPARRDPAWEPGRIRWRKNFFLCWTGFIFIRCANRIRMTWRRRRRLLRRSSEKYLRGMKWLNLGGGHHITRADYDRERLIRIVRHFRETYGVEVYLEPGEAVVLNAGFLVSRVEEIVSNDMEIAILDASAACHMPDVLEMPYRPPVKDSGAPGELAFTYRLGGPTCLAGDVMGDYSFAEPLKIGDPVVFEDMALYTMVKTNTFNGMRLPDIRILHADGSWELVKEFGYRDFKERLS